MQRQTNVLNLFVEFRFQLKTLFYFELRVSAGMIENLKTRDITLIPIMLSLNKSYKSIHCKYKYFDSTVQKAEDRRQKFYFCRLP